MYSMKSLILDNFLTKHPIFMVYLGELAQNL